jgi:glycosyltransferase involved in cell wall biosynthesis
MKPESLSLVVAVNDEQTLSHNLLRSHLVTSGTVELRKYRHTTSAGTAYNMGLDETTGDIVVFLHQDVYLPRGWLKKLKHQVIAVSAIDPNWTAIGVFGLDESASPVGRVWSSGRGQMLGQPLSEPVPAISLDELLLVVRRASGFRFDTDLPGFHLFGTDIVLSSRAAGLRCYVADLPVVHNSRPVLKLKADYGRAHRYMRRKWRRALPWPTLVVPLTTSALPLWRKQLGIRLQKGRRLQHCVDAATDPRHIAQQVGLEERDQAATVSMGEIG